MLLSKAFYCNSSNGAAQLSKVEGCGCAGQLPGMEQGVAKTTQALWTRTRHKDICPKSMADTVTVFFFFCIFLGCLGTEDVGMSHWIPVHETLIHTRHSRGNSEMGINVAPQKKRLVREKRKRKIAEVGKGSSRCRKLSTQFIRDSRDRNEPLVPHEIIRYTVSEIILHLYKWLKIIFAKVLLPQMVVLKCMIQVIWIFHKETVAWEDLVWHGWQA